MSKTNNERLQEIAEGMQNLNERLVYVGGAMAGSYGHRLTADDFNAEHERCFDFIRKAVSDSKAKTKIVLTHHVPTQKCTAKEFLGSAINGAFSVELGNYITDSGIDYWIYGHSHRNIETQIGQTKICSNQLGYISHGEYLTNGFDKKKRIIIL